jgi:hypothetical protein
VNKVFALAGAIALSIIPTPTFSGEVEQKEIMSVTEQLLPQIGEKYKNLDIKEKKAYKEALINYLEYVKKTGVSGVSEGVAVTNGSEINNRWREAWRDANFVTCDGMACTHPHGWAQNTIAVPDNEMWLWQGERPNFSW